MCCSTLDRVTVVAEYQRPACFMLCLRRKHASPFSFASTDRIDTSLCFILVTLLGLLVVLALDWRQGCMLDQLVHRAEVSKLTARRIRSHLAVYPPCRKLASRVTWCIPPVANLHGGHHDHRGGVDWPRRGLKKKARGEREREDGESME